MGKQAQRGRFAPQSGSKTHRPAKGLRYLLVAAVCALVAFSFYWLSKKHSVDRREEASLAAENAPQAEQESPELVTYPVASRSAQDTTRAATTAQSSTYSVVAARAYFHSEPSADRSTAKYVLRDDIIYAEGESGEFIKTRFYDPDGNPITGWLKKAELRLKSTASPRKTSRPATTQPSRQKAAATPKKPAPTPPPTPAAENKTAVTNGKITATGTVRVDTTYFYDSPDLTQRRRAFCIRGDKLRLSDSSDKAVFATFVNWEKVKTIGWIRKEDLRIKE